MVLDLMAQLHREFSERSKVERLLRELLDAKRNRSSEQLSQDKMALFASLWQARQASREAANTKEQEDSDHDEPGKPGASTNSPQKRGGRQALPRHLKRERIVHDLKDEEKHCARCAQDLRRIAEETSERYGKSGAARSRPDYGGAQRGGSQEDRSPDHHALSRGPR